MMVDASGLTAGKAIYGVMHNDSTGGQLFGDFVWRNTIGGTAGWEKISPVLNSPNTIALAVPAVTPLRGMNIGLDASGSLYVVAVEQYADTLAFDSFLWKTIDPTKAAASVEWGIVSMGGTAATPVIAAQHNVLSIAKITAGPKVFADSVLVGTGSSVLGSPAGSTLKATSIAFTDSLNAAGPTLGAPAAGATIAVNPITGIANNVVFTWPRAQQATGYTLQIALDDKFNTIVNNTNVPPIVAGNPLGTNDPVSVVIGPTTNTAGGAPFTFDTSTKYFVRVRAAGLTINTVNFAWFSPYSKANDITIGSGVPVVTPTLAVTLQAPAAGATGVALAPTFQWGAVTGANSYEIQIDTDPNFGAPVAKNNSVFTNVYVPTAPLNASTVYYWRVRATAGTQTGSFASGVFTTSTPVVAPTSVAPAPTPIITVPPYTPPPVQTPTYVWVIIVIGALLVIAVLALIVRTGRKG
jgi:hypothetical protein